MSKDYFVRLYAMENDDYNELWKTKDGKFFARNTYGYPTWSFVCDPLGYCELDHSCSNDYVFHVCDQKYNELFVSSNGGNSFPSYKAKCDMEWGSVKSRIDFTEDEDNLIYHAFTGNSSSVLNDWLLSFKDPEAYGEAAKDYDINWCMKTKEVGEEVIKKFDWCGIETTISKKHMVHTICGVEWYEFWCGTYRGAKFDSDNHGPMFAGREAYARIRNYLQEKYDCRTFWVYSECSYFGSSAREITLYEAKDMIFHEAGTRRDALISFLENKKEEEFLFPNEEKLSEKYPHCERFIKKTGLWF